MDNTIMDILFLRSLFDSLDIDFYVLAHSVKVIVSVLSFSRATACLRAERFGYCWMDALIHSTFFGVVTVRGRTGDFLFSSEPVTLKFNQLS